MERDIFSPFLNQKTAEVIRDCPGAKGSKRKRK
jgi:hypothetical protein